MSEGQNSDNLQTLFSFELLVEYVRIEKDSKVSDELALGLRLLDFPTLLIYQPQHRSGDSDQTGTHEEEEKRGEYAFNRGKSCFFQMNLKSLHIHLSNTPLYAMLLGVKEEIPKLVGSSLISLAGVMDRINQDVTEHGLSAPSSHGERGLVDMHSLTGEKIGSISLSYKLLSLGASLLPHIADRKDIKSTGVHKGQNVQETIQSLPLDTDRKDIKSTGVHKESIPSLPLDCGGVCLPILQENDVGKNVQNKGLANAEILISLDKQDNAAVCVSTEHRPRTQIPPTHQETENYFEEDLTLFCPPHLYYSNSAEEKSKNEQGDYKALTLDSQAFTFEDSCSENEMAENKTDGPSSPVMEQRVRCDTKTSRNQEKSRVNPNILGEALQQLPLLNALLVELSQLNGQNPNQPLSIHPNLAWIYRPASTEPSDVHGDTPKKMLMINRQGISPHFKRLHSPRNCSTPLVRPTSVQKKDKQDEALIESKSSSKSPRKKLVYGTTKTLNLRLKQISPLKVKHRECMKLLQNETLATSMTKGNTKSKNNIKSCKKKSLLNQSSSLNEDIETVIQRITVDSALQETTTLKQKSLHQKVHDKLDRDPQSISEKPSLSERGDFICISSVDSDSAAQNKEKNKYHSESPQSESESDRNTEKIEFSASSRHSSSKSSFSDSSAEGNEEPDYADDFNSLEVSDAYSPDPMSSPEPPRARNSKSPVCSNFCTSGPESIQKRAVLPVPVKAPSSPQRALRGTHIIRPRTHASALSFSSDDGDRDGSASLQTKCSREQMTERSRVEKSSGTESFISSRGQRSESTKNSSPVRGFSGESVSYFEPHEAEELEDELGSLDFRKEYQHISELVANKLPGYTM